MSIGFSKRREPPPRPQRELWKLTKGIHSVRATVRQTPLGAELLVFYDGEILWSRIMGDSRHIGVMADESRADWIAQGFRSTDCAACHGQGFVCEFHADQPVGHALDSGVPCGGAGMPCEYPGCHDSGRIRWDRLIASTSTSDDEPD